MPPQTSTKPLEFTATAGNYFVLLLVSGLLFYVPIIGIAFAFNYGGTFFAKYVKVNGRGLNYKAEVGETWVMLFVGLLLTVITLGIYMFWFAPKTIRFLYDHLSYADEAVAAPVTSAPPEATASPMADTTPAIAPTPPTTLVQQHLT